MRKIVLSLTGILILSIFVLAGCGSGPQQTSVADTGAFAVDFTKAPGVLGFVALGQPTDGVKSLQGKELTIEAWVRTNQHMVNKTSTPTSLLPYGTILGLGSDYEGVHLWINKNQNVQFEIQDFPGPGATNLPKFTLSDTLIGWEDVNGNGGGPKLADGDIHHANTWYHIAAVLVNDDHDHNGVCGTADSEKPHADIYINGVFDNCGSTGATFDGNVWTGGFTGPLDYVRSERSVCASGADATLGVVEDVDYVIEDGVCYPLDKHGNKFKFGTTIGRSPADWWYPNGNDERHTPARSFSGVIDEVRFWNVARTQAQIQENMKKEIEPQSGLIGYWKFNQGQQGTGTGNVVIDSSGSGKGGVKMYCDKDIVDFQDPDITHLNGWGCSGPVANALPWYDGWVELDKETEKDWKD